MRTIRAAFAAVSMLAVGLMVIHVQEARAAAPTPPFTQCPAVGSDTSCGILIVINPGGSLSIYQDPSQPPYENIEDTLVGVQNNSGGPVPSINLVTTTDAFGFDGDGLCTVNPHPVGCPFGPTGYEGPNTSFSNISADLSSGTVNFTQQGGLADAGSAYFSLEEALTAASFNPCNPNFTPTKTITTNVPGNLTVSGATVINGVTVGGNVIVQPGADVLIKHSTINGGLSSNGAHSLTLSDSTVKGGTTVTNSTGPVLIGQDSNQGCTGNTLRTLTVDGNKGGVKVAGNLTSGSVRVSNNTGGTSIEGNTIGGGLDCPGNNPAATNNGNPNSVSGPRSGQCTAKSF
jgi:hypothetical protein